MGGFATTNVCFSTPFESDPERPNGFVSKNAQEAIEEALALAVANDRFPLLFSYGGNANNGRYLEFFNNIDSNDAPIFFDSGSKCLAIVGATTSGSSNAKVGFFRDGVLLYEFDFNGNKRVVITGSIAAPIFTLAAMGELSVRVTQGSVLKPHFYAFFSTTI